MADFGDVLVTQTVHIREIFNKELSGGLRYERKGS